MTDGYGTAATTTTDTYDIAPGSCPSAPAGTTYCTQVENGLSNTTTSYYDALDHMIEQAPSQHHRPNRRHLHLRR